MTAIKKIKITAMLLLVITVSAFSQFLYTNQHMPKVATPAPQPSYDTILIRTWEGIKKRNINAYTLNSGPNAGRITGMIHRPKSEFPGDAVSEGISYGMFLALYMNDQAYFNRVWEAGEEFMWNSGNNWYDWHKNSQGGRGGSAFPDGIAADADQDIALLLIFADELVKKNIWRPYSRVGSNVTYESRARNILNTIRNELISNQGYLRPWAGGDIFNPGYFAPAFYRIFAEFDPANAAAWNSLVEGSYDLIRKSPGYARGLLPDWCTVDGRSTGGAGYNAYHAGDAMYRDAIRVYWRLAKDYIWFKEPRAKVFLDNAMAFIEDTLRSRGETWGPDAVDYFTMAGNMLPENDVERLRGNTITRSRREQSPLTAGMWAAAAIGTGNMEMAERYSAKLLEFYEGGDYWGLAQDPRPNGGRWIGTGNTVSGTIAVNAYVPEDTARNEMYFEQFLGWFGAALLAGVTTNVWQDMKDDIHLGPPTWRVSPYYTPVNGDIDASDPSKGPLRLSARLSRAVNWTVTLRHDTQNRSITFRGNSDSISVVWHGLSETNEYMPQGYYYLTISAAGLEYRNRVWLGRPYAGSIPNILVGNRLLVDDFADGDLIPYIGSAWRTYSDGGNSSAVMRPTVASGNTRSQLEWDYNIRDGASYPFIALDWDCGTMNLTGVDSIIIVARSGSVPSLPVQVHLIDTPDPNNYRYFATEITLTPTFQTHRMHLSPTTFRQRYDGNDKNFNTVISALLGVRFHMQGSYLPEGSSRSDAIIIREMYLAGPNNVLSGLYTPPRPPPDYIAPPDGPINVTHRANVSSGYSVRRAGNRVMITLPQSMVGADARVVDIRGKVVRRTTVQPNARLDIKTDNLAVGVYFVEIKKPGVTTLRLPLRNVR